MAAYVQTHGARPDLPRRGSPRRRGRRRPRRGAVPHQLRDVPQRRRRRRCPHRGQVRAGARPDERAAHVRRDGHRPAEHAGLQRHEPHARGQARHHLRRCCSCRRTSRPAVSRSASLGPVSEGLFIWIFGIGALIADHRVDHGEVQLTDTTSTTQRGAAWHTRTTRSSTRGLRGSPRPGSPSRSPTRCATPELPPHRARMTDKDPAAMKRAVRTVYTLFYLSVAASIWAIAAYLLFPIERRLDRRASATTTSSSASASAWRCSPSASARSTGRRRSCRTRSSSSPATPRAAATRRVPPPSRRSPTPTRSPASAAAR